MHAVCERDLDTLLLNNGFILVDIGSSYDKELIIFFAILFMLNIH